MYKIRFWKYLIVIVLVVSLLGGCLGGGQKDHNMSGYGQFSNDNNQILSQAEQKLQDKYEEVKKLTLPFIDRIKNINNPNTEINSISSSEARNKLKELYDLNENLIKNNFPKQDQLQKIKILITEISNNVIQPTQKGLIPDSIKQIQKNLGLENTGNFDQNTQVTIVNYLTNKLIELGNEIVYLKSVKPTTNDLIKDYLDNFYREEINKNSKSIEDINQTINNLWRCLNVLVVMNLVALIAFIRYIFGRRSRERQNEKVTSPPPETSDYPGLNPQQEQEILEKLRIYVNDIIKQTNKGLNPQQEKVILKKLQIYVNKMIKQNNKKLRQLEDNTTEKIPSHPTSPAKTKSSNNNLVDQYNQNPDYFLQNSFEVSETKESFENRRAGYNQPPILTKSDRNRGIGWITCFNNSHYLVPRAKLKINQPNYKILEGFFNCQNYNPEYPTDKFTLIKVARVSPYGEDWQLLEKGDLRFD